MPDLGKYLTELPEALTLDDDDILYTVVGSGTTTSKKVKKSTILSADRTARATAEGTIASNFAQEYSTTTQYAVGDYCIKDLVLYKCTSPTSGTWDSSKWTQADVSDIAEDSSKVQDVKVNGTSVVDENKNANVTVPVLDVTVNGGSVVDNNKNAVLDSLVAYGEASGEIATFSDGSDLAMKSLKVAITPQQDLHGYDAPWVGGAGKNKFDESNFNDDTSWQYYTLTLNPNTTYTASSNNGNYYEDNTFPQLYVYATGSGAGSNNAVYTGHSVNITTGSDGVLKVQWKTNNNSKKMTSYHLQVEQGNQATSYAPYSNICPISGWDEVNVQVNDGQNLFGGTFNTLFPLFIPKNTKITVSAKTQTSFAVFNKDKNQIDYWGLYDVDTTTGRYYRTFNFQYDIYYVKFIYTSAEELQIKYGTDVTYSPYNGSTYTIDLGGTRYGGTLDVVSGVMTITHGYLNLNTANLQGTNQYASWYNCGVKNIVKSGINSNISNINNFGFSQYICANTTNGGDTLFIMNSYTGITLAQWQAMAIDCQFVIPMFTPQAIQLTPTQVKSLLGVNNVWADCGDVDVSYVRDLTTTINYILEQLEG